VPPTFGCLVFARRAKFLKKIKTRLALELAHHPRALPEGDARFVHFETREPFDLWAETRGTAKMLLVFGIGPGYRALGVMTDSAMVWFRIGSHAGYDHLVGYLRPIPRSADQLSSKALTGR
jgi:hypothetical protein